MIESQGIDKVIARCPHGLRRAVGRQAIDLRAANVDDTGEGSGCECRGRSNGRGGRRGGWGDRDGWSGHNRTHGRRRSGRRGRRPALLAGSGGIDIACEVHGESGDLLFGCAVQDEGFALRGDAIDQATAVGAGDEVAAIVEVEGANLGFVALEEEAAIAARSTRKSSPRSPVPM